jgi:hypothetical protein
MTYGNWCLKSAAFVLMCMFLIAEVQGQTPKIPQPTTVAAKTLTGVPSGSGAHVNDGIPCLLNAVQLAQLRGQQPPKYLTQSGAKEIEKAVAATAEDLFAQKIITKPVLESLTTKLANDLVGSDASQAIDKVRGAMETTLEEQEKLKPEERITPSNKNIASDAIVGAAIDAANISFEAPPDVACSMSLLTYQETSDIFGVRVAKDYIAVQVIVRNLNQQDEYLLHDVQLAVDTDPCGSFSQVDGGRDRLLVRAVALRNQFTDPRNWAVRILEGVGTVASSAVGFAPKDYSLGLGIFNGLTPAVKAIFPDYTVDQLNRLSDLAFTSSGQTRTIVGKNGAAMFVTFFPAKPLEQAWWISDAGAIPNTSGQASAASSLPCTKELNARQAHFAEVPPATNPQAPSPDESTTQRKAVFSPKSVPYSKWKPNALLEFRKHTFVTVSGVHIAQENDLLPSLQELACPETNGFLNLNQSIAKADTPGTEATPAVAKPPQANAPVAAGAPTAAIRPSGAAHTGNTKSNALTAPKTDGATSVAAAIVPSPSSRAETGAAPPFECEVKGKNLDKVVQVRFRDAKDSLDKTVADGTMVIKTGDSTQGTTRFALDDLKALTGDTYNVFWMDKTKIENKTDLMVKISPYLAKVDPSTLALKDLSTTTFKLTGTNLGLVSRVQLVFSSNIATELVIGKRNAVEISVSYAKDTTPLVAGNYKIVLVLNDGTAMMGTTNNTIILK